MKKSVMGFLIAVLLLFFLARWTNPPHLDDVNPNIQCEQKLIEQSDVLWVIPFYENKGISENKEWCKYILSLNKTLGLHGVYHTYDEFETEDRDQAYLNKGINEFYKCFGYKPTMFKPPQLALSKKNELLVRQNFVLSYFREQILSKVYHCNDSGRFKNNFIMAF